MEKECLFLSVEQAAEMVGVGRTTVWRLVRAGEWPSVRIGRRVVLPKARLLELLGVAA